MLNYSKILPDTRTFAQKGQSKLKCNILFNEVDTIVLGAYCQFL